MDKDVKVIKIISKKGGMHKLCAKVPFYRQSVTKHMAKSWTKGESFHICFCVRSTPVAKD